MPYVLADETRKARKEHTCELCNGKIEIGQKYHRQKGIFDDFYSWKTHLECLDLANKLNMFQDSAFNYDGLTQDYFIETLYEYVQTHREDYLEYWKTTPVYQIVKDVLNELTQAQNKNEQH